MTHAATLRPRRSALYMPGANARALEKAKSLAADVIILDLEDSVAPEAKATAREQVAAAVAAGGYGPREVVIRVNALDSAWGTADLAAAAKAGADAVLVPKVSTPEEIEKIRVALAHVGASESLAVWAMIETPLGVINAPAIAAAGTENARNRLACFVVGTNDLVKETRASLDADRTAALYWLSATLTAARAYGIDVLDGVYNNFRDLEGFARECHHGKMLGMDGKTLIHPGQIDGANEIFAPDAAEVAWARTILAAFEQPEAQGKGVITIDGKMVELLHAEMARRTVAIADAITARA